jgi:hypothetical protein
MKKRFLIIILLALSVEFISVSAKASMTIATFADPSIGSRPLFRVDFRLAQMKLTGGWADTKTGLTLEIPYSGHTFANAWFEMTDVVILNTSGDTGGGEINFYADGSTTSLLAINFESGFVSRYSFGADEFFAENVTITGSEITDTLSEEQFAFSFANKKKLSSANPNDGFTATAAFTSSAVILVPPPIPEPATICLLGLGALSVVRRKK